MPYYKPNNKKNVVLKFELPSTPGSEIGIPSRLGYGPRIKVRSAAYKVHVESDEQGNDRVFQTVDPAAAERELLIESLCDPRTYHNLQDEAGNPLYINPGWIANDMDEEDALWLGQMLMGQMQEDLGLEDTSSAEGEVEQKPESKSSTTGKRPSEPTPEAKA